jgi:hypothetical protein
MNKKIIFALLALILLVVVVLILISQRGGDMNNVLNNNADTNEVGNQNNNSLPVVKEYTTSATVKSIQGNTIIVTVPILDTGSDGKSRFIDQEKKIEVTNATQYFFTSSNGIKSPAKVSDIKPRIKISITALQDLSKNSTATAVVIEILK